MRTWKCSKCAANPKIQAHPFTSMVVSSFVYEQIVEWNVNIWRIEELINWIFELIFFLVRLCFNGRAEILINWMAKCTESGKEFERCTQTMKFSSVLERKKFIKSVRRRLQVAYAIHSYLISKKDVLPTTPKQRNRFSSGDIFIDFTLQFCYAGKTKAPCNFEFVLVG